MNLLPGINYNATPGFNEFEFLHQIYTQEFQNRADISCTPGIVDWTGNPAAAPFTADRALSVQVSTANPLTINISQGFAVTDNLNLIVIDAAIPSVPLPNLTAGQTYVVMAKYVLIPSVETRINRFGNPAEVREERPSNSPYGGGVSTLIDALSVDTLTNFNNTSLYPTSAKQDIVVLAIVTSYANPTTGQLTLTVDLTQATYAFNRPWFSTVDITHRNMVGSGVVTNNNPHGIELQDLSSAGFTLYQQWNPRGGVFAKDSTYYGYPGTFCSELLTIARFQVDTTGTLTAPVGKTPLAGRYYAQLTDVPVRTGSCYFPSTPWQPIPYEWIQGTRTIVLGALENPNDYGNSVVIEYFKVSALEIGAENHSQGIQTLSVASPLQGSEYIIASGVALQTINQNSVPLAGALGPIKRSYQVLCESTGEMVLSPEPIADAIQVADLISQNTIAINQAPHKGLPVTITVGLTNTPKTSQTTGFELNLQVQIQGLDQNGSTAQENLTFYASQWNDQSSADVEEPMQCQTTRTTFSMVNGVKILNTASTPDNTGPDAVISIWANILENKGNQEMANVASFFWTGVTGIKFVDERVIGTTIQRPDQRQYRFPQQLPENDASFTQELFSVLLDPPLTNPNLQSKHLALELDDDRCWSETWKSFSSTGASGSILLSNLSAITHGMTLRVAEGKYLTFVNPSLVTPDASKGIIPIAGTSTDENNDIIATLNDPVFDSTWFSSIGSGTPPAINMTRAGAYPDGFIECVRRKLAFTLAFTSGSFSCNINGTPIGPIPALGTHQASVDAVIAAVNAVSPTTGVTAVETSNGTGVTPAIMFNGLPDGQPYDLSNIKIVGATNSLTLTVPSDPFILTQPTGGTLATGHLPNRYLSSQTPWQYLTRPMLWEGVFLQARISVITVTTIHNLDQIEIVPGKVIVAVASPADANPTIGRFLFTNSSLSQTLSAMVATINNPTFAAGCYAMLSPDGNSILLNLGGVASASISLLVETIPNTWMIENYAPVGGGSLIANGFLKSINPLTSAMWRFQSVENYGMWSPWLDMDLVSPTAYMFNPEPTVVKLTGVASNVAFVTSTFGVYEGMQVEGLGVVPGTVVQSFVTNTSITLSKIPSVSSGSILTLHQSLYQVQIRLIGEPGISNGFSLYRITPQVSDATLAGLQTIVGTPTGPIGPNGISGNVTALQVSVSSVESKLNPLIAEVTAARSGVITPMTSSLKARLDNLDEWVYWGLATTVNGGVGGSLPTDTADFSATNALISGPTAGISNPTSPTAASFITSGSSASKLVIGGTTTQPLVYRYGGLPYRSVTPQTIDFASLTSGTYYFVATRTAGTTYPIPNQELGLQMDGSGLTTVGSVVAGTNSLTASAALPMSQYAFPYVPLVLYFPGLTPEGLPWTTGSRPLIVPIASVIGNSIAIKGSFPAISSNTAFQIWSIQELPFTTTTTAPAWNPAYGSASQPLYFGQVTWNGSGFSNSCSYAYQGKYVSIPVSAMADSNMPTFNHNLGFLPSAFTLYYSTTATPNNTTDIPKPLNLGDEVVVQTTTTTLSVRNRYAGLLARTYTSGTSMGTGYIQLVI